MPDIERAATLWHARESAELFAALGTSPEGLTEEEAALRLREMGRTSCRTRRRRGRFAASCASSIIC